MHAMPYFDHLRQVTQVLSDFRYGAADVDQFVIDGWHLTGPNRPRDR